MWVATQDLPPGRCFRLLLLGYFEGLDSERAIARRAADSLSVRSFVGLDRHEAPPDHSTVSRTRRLINVEMHQAVFTWVLQRRSDAHRVKGKTIGIDATTTTLEANAALSSSVLRDTGERDEEFLKQLAQASGIEMPTRADLACLDRKCKYKGSNDDGRPPHDPDAEIKKMRDGRTYFAHKAEHVVDLETGRVVALTVQDADEGDTTTSIETLPARGRRNWKKLSEARDAVYRNRRRIRDVRGEHLLRQRVGRLERPCAYLYETGRMRCVHRQGHGNILKRLLLHAGALNLGLLMRQLVGIGTPRSLQSRALALLRCVCSLVRLPETFWALSGLFINLINLRRRLTTYSRGVTVIGWTCP